MAFESIPDPHGLYLTFDDGPHPDYTPRLLDTLAEHSAKATFFVLGQQAERHPQIVERIVAEGHAIGNHTYSHPAPGTVSPDEYVREVDRTNVLIHEITGRQPSLFRPPHGKLTWKTMRPLWKRGFSIALWNVDPRDYTMSSSEELSAWVRDCDLGAGDVVLLHDVHEHAIGAVPAIAEIVERIGVAAREIPSAVKVST